MKSKPGYLVHRLNMPGVAACGVREFVTPGKHAFSMRQTDVTCPTCRDRRLRVIKFTHPVVLKALAILMLLGTMVLGCGDDAGTYYLECLAPGVARVYGPGPAEASCEEIAALPFCVSDVASETPQLKTCQLALESVPLCKDRMAAVPLVP